ncbi:MAG: hypothetical protein VW378_06925 [bacterium]
MALHIDSSFIAQPEDDSLELSTPDQNNRPVSPIPFPQTTPSSDTLAPKHYDLAPDLSNTLKSLASQLEALSFDDDMNRDGIKTALTTLASADPLPPTTLAALKRFFVSQADSLSSLDIDIATQNRLLACLEQMTIQQQRDLAPWDSLKSSFETTLSPRAWAFRKQQYLVNSQDGHIRDTVRQLFESGQLSAGMSIEELSVKLLNYVQKRFRYVSETSTHALGSTDHWQSIGETFATQQGDCEDLAIVQASLLLHVLEDYKGISFDQSRRMVQLAAGYAQTSDGPQGHMLVFLNLPEAQYVLDPSLGKGLEPRSDNDFDTVFVFNDQHFEQRQEIAANFHTAYGLGFAGESVNFGATPNASILAGHSPNRLQDTTPISSLYHYDPNDPQFSLHDHLFQAGANVEAAVFNKDWAEVFRMPHIETKGNSRSYMYDFVSYTEYLLYKQYIDADEDPSTAAVASSSTTDLTAYQAKLTEIRDKEAAIESSNTSIQTLISSVLSVVSRESQQGIYQFVDYQDSPRGIRFNNGTFYALPSLNSFENSGSTVNDLESAQTWQTNLTALVSDMTHFLSSHPDMFDLASFAQLPANAQTLITEITQFRQLVQELAALNDALAALTPPASALQTSSADNPDPDSSGGDYITKLKSVDLEEKLSLLRQDLGITGEANLMADLIQHGFITKVDNSSHYYIFDDDATRLNAIFPSSGLSANERSALLHGLHSILKNNKSRFMIRLDKTYYAYLKSKGQTDLFGNYTFFNVNLKYFKGPSTTDKISGAGEVDTYDSDEMDDYIQLLSFKDIGPSSDGYFDHPLDKLGTEIRDALTRVEMVVALASDFITTMEDAVANIPAAAAGDPQKRADTAEKEKILQGLNNTISALTQKINTTFTTLRNQIFESVKSINDVMHQLAELRIDQYARVEFENEGDDLNYAEMAANFIYGATTDLLDGLGVGFEKTRAEYRVHLQKLVTENTEKNMTFIYAYFTNFMTRIHQKSRLSYQDNSTLRSDSYTDKLIPSLDHALRDRSDQLLADPGSTFQYSNGRLQRDPLYGSDNLQDGKPDDAFWSQEDFTTSRYTQDFEGNKVRHFNLEHFFPAFDSFRTTFNTALDAVNPFNTSSDMAPIQRFVANFEYDRIDTQNIDFSTGSFQLPDLSGNLAAVASNPSASTPYRLFHPQMRDDRIRAGQDDSGRLFMRHQRGAMRSDVIYTPGTSAKDILGKSNDIDAEDVLSEDSSIVASILDQIQNGISSVTDLGSISQLLVPSEATRTSPFIDMNSFWYVDLLDKLNAYERFLNLLFISLSAIQQYQLDAAAGIAQAAGAQSRPVKTTVNKIMSSRFMAEFSLANQTLEKLNDQFKDYKEAINTLIKHQQEYYLNNLEQTLNITKSTVAITNFGIAQGLATALEVASKAWSAPGSPPPIPKQFSFPVFWRVGSGIVDRAFDEKEYNIHKTFYRYQTPYLLQYYPVLFPKNKWSPLYDQEDDLARVSLGRGGGFYGVDSLTNFSPSFSAANHNNAPYDSRHKPFDNSIYQGSNEATPDQFWMTNRLNGSLAARTDLLLGQYPKLDYRRNSLFFDGTPSAKNRLSQDFLAKSYFHLDDTRIALRRLAAGRIETLPTGTGFAGDDNNALLDYRIPHLEHAFPGRQETQKLPLLLPTGSGGFTKNSLALSMIEQSHFRGMQGLEMYFNIWMHYLETLSNTTASILQLFAKTSSRHQLTLSSLDQLRDGLQQAFSTLVSFETSLKDTFKSELDTLITAFKHNVDVNKTIRKKYYDFSESMLDFSLSLYALRQILNTGPAAYISPIPWMRAKKRLEAQDLILDLVESPLSHSQPYSDLRTTYFEQPRIDERMNTLADWRRTQSSAFDMELYQGNPGHHFYDEYNEPLYNSPSHPNQSRLNSVSSPHTFLPSYALRDLDISSDGQSATLSDEGQRHYHARDFLSLFHHHTSDSTPFFNGLHTQSMDNLRALSQPNINGNNGDSNYDELFSRSVSADPFYYPALTSRATRNNFISDSNSGSYVPNFGTFRSLEPLEEGQPNFINRSGRFENSSQTFKTGIFDSTKNDVRAYDGSIESQYDTDGSALFDFALNFSQLNFENLALMDEKMNVDYLQRLKLFQLINMYTDTLRKSVDKVIRDFSGVENRSSQGVMQQAMQALDAYSQVQQALSSAFVEELSAQVQLYNDYLTTKTTLTLETAVDTVYLAAISSYVIASAVGATAETKTSMKDKLEKLISAQRVVKGIKTVATAVVGLYRFFSLRDAASSKHSNLLTDFFPVDDTLAASTDDVSDTDDKKKNAALNREKDDGLRASNIVKNVGGSTVETKLNDAQLIKTSSMGTTIINRGALIKKRLELKKQKNRATMVMDIFDSAMQTLASASDVAGQGAVIGNAFSMSKKGMGAFQSLLSRKLDRLTAKLEQLKESRDRAVNDIRSIVFEFVTKMGVLGLKAFGGRVMSSSQGKKATAALSKKWLRIKFKLKFKNNLFSSNNSARKLKFIFNKLVFPQGFSENTGFLQLFIARILGNLAKSEGALQSSFDSEDMFQDGSDLGDAGGISGDQLPTADMENLMFEADLMKGNVQIRKELLKEQKALQGMFSTDISLSLQHFMQKVFERFLLKRYLNKTSPTSTTAAVFVNTLRAIPFLLLDKKKKKLRRLDIMHDKNLNNILFADGQEDDWNKGETPFINPLTRALAQKMGVDGKSALMTPQEVKEHAKKLANLDPINDLDKMPSDQKALFHPSDAELEEKFAEEWEKKTNPEKASEIRLEFQDLNTSQQNKFADDATRYGMAADDFRQNKPNTDIPLLDSIYKEVFIKREKEKEKENAVNAVKKRHKKKRMLLNGILAAASLPVSVPGEVLSYISSKINPKPDSTTAKVGDVTSHIIGGLGDILSSPFIESRLSRDAKDLSFKVGQKWSNSTIGRTFTNMHNWLVTDIPTNKPFNLLRRVLLSLSLPVSLIKLIFPHNWVYLTAFLDVLVNNSSHTKDSQALLKDGFVGLTGMTRHAWPMTDPNPTDPQDILKEAVRTEKDDRRHILQHGSAYEPSAEVGDMAGIATFANIKNIKTTVSDHFDDTDGQNKAPTSQELRVLMALGDVPSTTTSDDIKQDAAEGLSQIFDKLGLTAAIQSHKSKKEIHGILRYGLKIARDATDPGKREALLSGGTKLSDEQKQGLTSILPDKNAEDTLMAQLVGFIDPKTSAAEVRKHAVQLAAKHANANSTTASIKDSIAQFETAIHGFGKDSKGKGGFSKGLTGLKERREMVQKLTQSYDAYRDYADSSSSKYFRSKEARQILGDVLQTGSAHTFEDDDGSLVSKLKELSGDSDEGGLETTLEELLKLKSDDSTIFKKLREGLSQGSFNKNDVANFLSGNTTSQNLVQILGSTGLSNPLDSTLSNNIANVLNALGATDEPSFDSDTLSFEDIGLAYSMLSLNKSQLNWQMGAGGTSSINPKKALKLLHSSDSKQGLALYDDHIEALRKKKVGIDFEGTKKGFTFRTRKAKDPIASQLFDQLTQARLEVADEDDRENPAYLSRLPSEQTTHLTDHPSSFLKSLQRRADDSVNASVLAREFIGYMWGQMQYASGDPGSPQTIIEEKRALNALISLKKDFAILDKQTKERILEGVKNLNDQGGGGILRDETKRFLGHVLRGDSLAFNADIAQLSGFEDFDTEDEAYEVLRKKDKDEVDLFKRDQLVLRMEPYKKQAPDSPNPAGNAGGLAVAGPQNTQGPGTMAVAGPQNTQGPGTMAVAGSQNTQGPGTMAVAGSQTQGPVALAALGPQTTPTSAQAVSTDGSAPVPGAPVAESMAFAVENLAQEYAEKFAESDDAKDPAVASKIVSHAQAYIKKFQKHFSSLDKAESKRIEKLIQKYIKEPKDPGDVAINTFAIAASLDSIVANPSSPHILPQFDINHFMEQDEATATLRTAYTQFLSPTLRSKLSHLSDNLDSIDDDDPNTPHPKAQQRESHSSSEDTEDEDLLFDDRVDLAPLQLAPSSLSEDLVAALVDLSFASLSEDAMACFESVYALVVKALLSRFNDMGRPKALLALESLTPDSPPGTLQRQLIEDCFSLSCVDPSLASLFSLLEVAYVVSQWPQQSALLHVYLLYVTPLSQLQVWLQGHSSVTLSGSLRFDLTAYHSQRSLQVLQRLYTLAGDHAFVSDALSQSDTDFLALLSQPLTELAQRPFWLAACHAMAVFYEASDPCLTNRRLQVSLQRCYAFQEDLFGTGLHTVITARLDTQPSLLRLWQASGCWLAFLGSLSELEFSTLTSLLPEIDAALLKQLYTHCRTRSQLESVLEQPWSVFQDKKHLARIPTFLMTCPELLVKGLYYHPRYFVQFCLACAHFPHHKLYQDLFDLLPSSITDQLQPLLRHAVAILSCLHTPTPDHWLMMILARRMDQRHRLTMLWALWLLDSTLFTSVFTSFHGRISASLFHYLRLDTGQPLAASSCRSLFKSLKKEGYINASSYPTARLHEGVLQQHAPLQSLAASFGLHLRSLCQRLHLLRDQQERWVSLFSQHPPDGLHLLPAFSRFRHALTRMTGYFSSQTHDQFNRIDALALSGLDTVSTPTLGLSHLKELLSLLRPYEARFRLSVDKDVANVLTRRPCFTFAYVFQLWTLFDHLLRQHFMQQELGHTLESIWRSLSKQLLLFALGSHTIASDSEALSQLLSTLFSYDSKGFQHPFHWAFSRGTALQRSALFTMLLAIPSISLPDLLRCIGFVDPSKPYPAAIAAALPLDDAQLLLAYCDSGQGHLPAHCLLPALQSYYTSQPTAIGFLKTALFLNQAQPGLSVRDWQLFPVLLSIDTETLLGFLVLLDPTLRQTCLRFVQQKRHDISDLDTHLSQTLQDCHHGRCHTSGPLLLAQLCFLLRFTQHTDKAVVFASACQKLPAEHCSSLLDLILQDPRHSQALFLLFDSQEGLNTCFSQALCKTASSLPAKSWFMAFRSPSLKKALLDMALLNPQYAHLPALVIEQSKTASIPLDDVPELYLALGCQWASVTESVPFSSAELPPSPSPDDNSFIDTSTWMLRFSRSQGLSITQKKLFHHALRDPDFVSAFVRHLDQMLDTKVPEALIILQRLLSQGHFKHQSFFHTLWQSLLEIDPVLSSTFQATLTQHMTQPRSQQQPQDFQRLLTLLLPFLDSASKHQIKTYYVGRSSKKKAPQKNTV